MRWFLIPVAIAAGTLMVIQAACNSALERAWERPVTVGAISLSIGISALVLFGFVFGQLGLPSGKAAQAPWWAWLGGLCGALSLLSQPLAAPRLGAAIYVGLFVTASSVASVIADHFGWLGFDQHAAGLGRIAGCALMVIGIALVSLFQPRHIARQPEWTLGYWCRTGELLSLGRRGVIMVKIFPGL